MVGRAQVVGFFRHSLAGPLGRGALLLCAVAFAAQCLETASTVALRDLVNALSSSAAPGLRAAAIAAMLFIGAAAAAAACSAVFLRFDTKLRRELLSRMERTLFARTLSRPAAFFHRRPPGEIGHQVRSATEAASTLFNTFTYYGVRFVAMALSAAVVFWHSVPLLNAVTLAWVAAFLAGSYYITRNCAALSRQVAARAGAATGLMIDSLRNISAVRAFGRQAFEHEHVGRGVDAERQAQARLRIEFYRLFLFQVACKSVLNIAVIAAALFALLEGRSDVGSVVMLITLANVIAALVQEMSNRMYEVFDNYGTLSHALAYLSEPEGVGQAPGARPLAPADASVRFERVEFAYPGAAFTLEVDLAIRAGEKVGIVGPSGAGKSTLLRLLKREYDPGEGRVLVGGQDLRGCTLLSLTEAIAEVPQQTRLFNRSIRENIAYGRPDAAEAEILRAAREAQCLDFIAARPDGLDSPVGEDGAHLSGGERQRLLIARAILRNAPILLLDEATASLDAASESCVQQALARLVAGKTVIAIAHRPATLELVDRIVVLAGGRVVRDGRGPGAIIAA